MSSWRADRKILLGISGGIAAYKTPELVRAWVKADCDVEIILTDAATKLVSPLALSTLSKRRSWRDSDLLSDELGWRIPHITLADWADVFVIAPCTANVLSMAARGDSSTLLGATLLACQAPVVLFPAMNEHMWDNPATQSSVTRVQEMGYTVVAPDSGPLACGYEGKGRLPSTDAIVERTWRAIYPKKNLTGKRVMITAGPTREYIDPVRYISNPSSGKMGYAIALDALRRGADVVLITGPVGIDPPYGAEVVRVETAAEMFNACMTRAPMCDVVIKAAAVGDYRAASYSEKKIKRGDVDRISIELEQNPDIAKELGKVKRAGQILVGFAAETTDVEANAMVKLGAKNLDMIVANDVTSPDAGFGYDTNRIEIITGNGASRKFFGTKAEVAEAIWDRISLMMQTEAS